MPAAKELMLKEYASIDSEMPCSAVVEKILQSAGQVLAVFERKKYLGLITTHSLVTLERGGTSPVSKKAGELLLDPCPEISPDTDLSGVLAVLQQQPVIAVKSKQGKLEGVITGSLLALKLAVSAQELEKELDAVIAFSSDEILIADREGRVLRASRQFEDNFGVELDAVLGKTVDELEKKKVFYPSVTRLVLDKKEVQTVIQSRRDGRKLLATGTPAFNDDGSIFRVVVNTRDITKLNNLKQKLEETELLKNRYQQELVELRQGYLGSSDLIAESPAMVDLVRMAQKIAAVDSTVLLTGESGVGKGMIARFIHSCSPRSAKPFTVVNCGAIPENLLESELFGYAGGAFTGALKEGKIGKLELANKGTLFLDEIADLPLNLQVKLLHVIQEGVISRIGSTREIILNLRFIAATNRDIATLVEEGKFREDLYFRLDVIPLLVPPLRERREDIRKLTAAFLEKLNRRYQKQKSFSAEALTMFEAYQWPGNVRELENLIERMIIVAEVEEITPQSLPGYLLGESKKESFLQAAKGDLPPLKEALETLEKELLTKAMQRYRTTYEIAVALQVDQSTVVRKIHKHKLS
ncbi:MAG: PAS domain S-box protein [Firmicutes bacterium]|nr:PAS domain S-box protein [Bacillota bacterium]